MVSLFGRGFDSLQLHGLDEGSTPSSSTKFSHEGRMLTLKTIKYEKHEAFQRISVDVDDGRRVVV